MCLTRFYIVHFQVWLACVAQAALELITGPCHMPSFFPAGFRDCTMQVCGPLYRYTKPLFLIFLLNLRMCMCEYSCMHICYRTCVVVRGQLAGVGSLPLVGQRDQTQVVMLDSKRLHQLSHAPQT